MWFHKLLLCNRKKDPHSHWTSQPDLRQLSLFAPQRLRRRVCSLGTRPALPAWAKDASPAPTWAGTTRWVGDTNLLYIHQYNVALSRNQCVSHNRNQNLYPLLHSCTLSAWTSLEVGVSSLFLSLLTGARTSTANTKTAASTWLTKSISTGSLLRSYLYWIMAPPILRDLHTLLEHGWNAANLEKKCIMCLFCALTI